MKICRSEFLRAPRAMLSTVRCGTSPRVLTGQSVTEQLGYGSVPALPSALTIGLDTVDAMHAAAEKLRGASVIKAKLGADDPAARLRGCARGSA